MSNAILVLLASLLSSFGGARSATPSTATPSTATPSTGGHSGELDLGSALEGPRREITFYFENRREALGIALFGDATHEGIAPVALRELSHFVRCYRTDRERPIHPRLAEIVARVADAFGRDTVDVISGFRAPPYGAPHSKHFLGRAMDLRLPGVPSKKLAAWVWRNFRGVGVGVYPNQNFVHIDVREADVRWVDTSLHGESANAHYFGRRPSEQLPADAPRLAYDEPKPDPSARLLASIHAALLPRGISDGY